jgi:hypothetical protein
MHAGSAQFRLGSPSLVLTAATLPFKEAPAGVAERRLSIAIAVSVLIHALTLAALRGLIPSVYSYAAGGVGTVAALQAVLAGPPIEVQPEEPLPLLPLPMLNTKLLAPPVMKPVETTFGRTRPPPSGLPGGGPSRPGQTTPDANVAVGTIDDPARLGSDYAAQLAQRFPDRAAKVPMLLGAPVVVYPSTALEQGIEGRFAAVVTLDALGHIKDAKLVVDDAIFGPAMLNALKSAQFAPAEFDGNPVPYWAIVEFIFTIGRPATVASTPSATARNRTLPPRQPSVGR